MSSGLIHKPYLIIGLIIFWPSIHCVAGYSDWTWCSRPSSTIFYGESILDYKLELELMGVRVRQGDAINYYRLMADNLKLPPNLSTPEAFLLLLKCIRHVGLTGSYLERLKQIKAIKTNLGFRLPTESVLPVLEWDCLFTVLVGIPVLDVQFYGEGIIRTYRPELSKLGVAVRSEEVSKVVSFRFKQLVSSCFFVKDNVLSLLECYKQLKQKQIMLPVDLISCMKMEKWLQTKMGLTAPVDAVLFNSDWDAVASMATVPFIENSSDFERYKDELKALGVAVTLQQGAGFFLKGINLPIDPSSMTPSSSLLLLKCIKYWKQYKTDLPKEFMGSINKKWLKTVVGYQCPDESLLFDSKHSSLIQKGDGPFIDEEFYGSEIALYKDQLKEIGVKVDISCGCSLVACHLKRHSKGSTIRRIYKFLREFKWEPENKNLSWIWVPNRGKGDWVCPKSCVLHDNCNLFDSQLHILDKFYEEDLLGFFSVAFDVKNMPDIENYMKLWEHWENGTSQVSLDDCLAFWEFIGMHWNPTCEKLLNKHVKKLPVLMGGSISLVSKLDLFISDDILLWDLFDKSLFVWYPAKSTQSLARSKLTCIYTSLGVRKFSEAVEKQESYTSDSEGADNGTTVKSSVNLVKEGLLRIILAFLSNPCLDICAAKRHEMVETLLNLTIIEADEPVNMQYKMTLSGGRSLEAKTTRMFHWERNESKLFMRRLDQLQGMEGRIKFATYISDEISKGLLFERADLRDSFAELIKVGCLLDYELTAVGFLLKNQNLQVFAEDEEFLSRSSRQSYALKFACSISVIIRVVGLVIIRVLAVALLFNIIVYFKF